MEEELKALKHHRLSVLKSLQYESGLFSAAAKRVDTGYDKAWIRDNFYVGLALLELDEKEAVQKMYNAFMAVLLKHEEKIDHAIDKKPEFSYQYIHPRYHPETFEEFWESWGNRQNDSIGSLLFFFGSLKKAGYSVLESENETNIVKKLIAYLKTIAYWQDPDSGVWEEWEEIHASSLAACIGGLKILKEVGIDVPEDMIQKGEDILHHELLPRESHDKFCDLALLTLIYPFNVANESETKEILRNVEYHLVRHKGVIRYKGDHYYNKNWDRWSEEAEWTFGFSFLSLAYHQLGNNEKALFYFERAKEAVNEKGEIPELYYSHSAKYNQNSPLAWSEAMFLLALNRTTS